jgi:hypothetical protein
LAYRLANAAWCLLLLYAMAVQYNDPDPLRWMAAYGIGALAAGYAAAMGTVPTAPVFGWAVLCLVLSGLNALFGAGQAEPMGGFPHWGILRDEVVREAGGLWLMGAWMVVLAIWTRVRVARGAA